MSTVSIAGIDVLPGERSMKMVQVAIADRSVAVPIMVINGLEEGPRVAVTAGIHGAEYVGIEAALRLGRSLDPSTVRGSIIVVPIANTEAFHARSIYVSGIDENNLNRSFPGRPDGTPSEALAHWLFQTVIRPSQFYIDLHGGDMIEALVPFVLYCGVENRQVEEASRQMAIATGIPRVIRSSTQGSTYGAAAAAGIPAILAEVGGQGVWDTALVEQHRLGAHSVLGRLGVVAQTPRENIEQRMYTAFDWMRASVNGLLHPLVGVGDRVDAGMHLGDITDYFGESLQALRAPVSGEIVFLVTCLAMNAGDPVLAVAH